MSVNQQTSKQHNWSKWGFLQTFYAAALKARHFLYNRNLLSSEKHEVPLIGVGNLSFGGSGKTPMIEYLLDFLGSGSDLAVLSRGYGRSSKGYKPVSGNSRVQDVGDELLQIKCKFPNVQVAACANRNEGVRALLKAHPNLSCILLDDNFQHRAIQVQLQLLLTPFSDPFHSDQLFPKGNLRDLKSRAQKADHLIITKCPSELSKSEQTPFEKALSPFHMNNQLSYSSIQYGQLHQLSNKKQTRSFDEVNAALLLTGIARLDELRSDLNKRIAHVELASFPDHHHFSEKDIEQHCDAFLQKNTSGIMICTEKDAVRLMEHVAFIKAKNYSFYVLPAKVHFLSGEEELQKAVRTVLTQTRRI